MTPNEFRAWLEGYSASFTDGCPNKEQWDAIKAKMDKVIGKPLNNGLGPNKSTPFWPVQHDPIRHDPNITWYYSPCSTSS